MTIDIYERGEPVGRLLLEREGLYARIEASCRPRGRGVMRLWVWNGTQGCCLGVPCPEGETFTLRSRRSAQALPFEPHTAVLGCGEGDFLPWRGSFEGVQIPHGYYSAQDEAYAIPWRQDEAFPLVHRAANAGRITLCGERCLLLHPGEAEKAPEDVPEKAPEDVPEQSRFHTEITACEV